MNVIVVAKFLKGPKKIVLRDPRTIGAIGLGLALLLGLGASLGYAFALLAGGARQGATNELAHLRAVIERQELDLAEARSHTELELNAIAVRMGELQAQSNRLNALGERLTRLGKLDDGEFDFNTVPGVGGPEGALAEVSDPGLTQMLDQFALRLHQQSEQLSVLESLLLDRDMEETLLPAGLPVRAGYASSSFGFRSDPFTGKREMHRGVDFSGARGSDILAVADGVVIFSGRDSGYGNMIDIDHGNGFMTRYAHHSQNLVEVGHRVRAGDVIAKMGATGRATGVHLHFEVWKDDKPVNPHQYLRSMRG
jgi:murein DD-endopeptidase MepM/ murein hydrolase activator NlpD